MKKVIIPTIVAIILATAGFAPSQAFANPTFPTLHVDSAPNVYGSPAWAPWWASAKDDVAAGAFTDMRTGTHPGTHTADPLDELVYSTMDLGKRIHWIYWLPGETVAGLSGLFEVKWVVDWAGSDWTYEGGALVADGPGIGWSEPSSWEDYDDGMGTTGVIGSLGFAWWAADNDALPGDTDGNPYNEVDQADIDASRAEILAAPQTYAIGMVRHRPTIGDPWKTTTLQVDIVPEPGTLCLLVLGGLGLARRRRS